MNVVPMSIFALLMACMATTFGALSGDPLNYVLAFLWVGLAVLWFARHRSHLPCR